MRLSMRHLAMRPRMLVVVPLVILAVMFALLILAVVQGQQPLTGEGSSFVIGGTALFAAAIALLFSMGTASAAQLERLERLSLTDTLCHLPNRRALHNDVQTQLRGGHLVAVALLDLDGFKLVNDLYGHIVGDRLIQKVAKEIEFCAAPHGRAYRLGGDEFALVLSGPDCGTKIDAIASKILTRLGEPIILDDRNIAVGASIGLSGGQYWDGLDSSELLRRADIAMYVSKRGGKACCNWFLEEHDRDIAAIAEMEDGLRAALANDELQIAYQPAVDPRSGSIMAIEALLRWRRANGSILWPETFIPIAEDSGLISAIGLLALRRACTEALDWERVLFGINVSAAQLRNPDFPQDLAAILAETGFPAGRLELEIAETTLLHNPKMIAHSLADLRNLGVRFSLDNFGTGYAAIGLLRSFRFEKLKIDRSLISGALEEDSARALMLASVAMAQAMDMEVIAEGVETEEQAALAQAAGCSQSQGWLYHKAVSAAEISQLLAPRPKQSGAAIQPASGGGSK